jgi:nickel superoxide dismutase
MEAIMKIIITSLATGFFLMFIMAGNVAAHCEIPCGIYDDQMRANLIYEHTVTIEKSMKKIAALSKEAPVNYNQLVRWISNKEEHATKIQHTISQYFMTQRLRPDAQKYPDKLSVLHKMLQAAMKCKQSIDIANVQILRSLLKKFEIMYFGHSLRES